MKGDPRGSVILNYDGKRVEAVVSKIFFENPIMEFDSDVLLVNLFKEAFNSMRKSIFARTEI